uniref:RNA-directed RNA polymerase n=1 Tax=Hubei levi-like virus 6 TaxID=1922918 RepID=A0A1L3KID6_9VIRU|nr:hypothetical protein [Hubei levi-like virus 6]
MSKPRTRNTKYGMLDGNHHEQLETIIRTYFNEERTDIGAEYLCASLLSKYADPDPQAAASRSDLAIKKLLATDSRNRDTEWRLRYLKPANNISLVLDDAKRIIAKVLGDFDVMEFLSSGSFSGGASVFTRAGSKSNPVEKFAASTACGNQFVADLTRKVFSIDCYIGPPLNVIFTVPKNDQIDRAAAKEYAWNMFWQKSAGTMIRCRLKRIGIDLNDQSINNRLARIASMGQLLSTLDLSSASDSITRELVWRLLPPDWFEILDNLRSLGSNLDGKFHLWSLFSTMGNGFTFELESLIFYALAKASVNRTVGKGVVSIYGDDIIVPSGEPTSLLISCLEYCGFAVNLDKSFTEGPFKESCGGHYFLGWEITPIYIREPIKTWQCCIKFLNSLRVYLLTTYGGDHAQLWAECYEYLLNHSKPQVIKVKTKHGKDRVIYLTLQDTRSGCVTLDDGNQCLFTDGSIYYPGAPIKRVMAVGIAKSFASTNPEGSRYWLYKTFGSTTVSETQLSVVALKSHTQYKSRRAGQLSVRFALNGELSA